MGKLVGRWRWPGTTKTVEGTLAFVVSIVFCAWILRVTGLTDDFSVRFFRFPPSECIRLIGSDAVVEVHSRYNLIGSVGGQFEAER